MPCLFYSVRSFSTVFYAVTLRVPVIHQAGNLLVWLGQRSKSQVHLIGNLLLSMFTEKVVLKPNDVSVFTTLTINGRLFACPREKFDSLVGVDGHLRAASAIRKTCLELNFAVTLNLVAKKSCTLLVFFFSAVYQVSLRCSFEMLWALDFPLWKFAKEHHCWGIIQLSELFVVIHVLEMSPV